MYNYDASRPMKTIPRSMFWNSIQGIAKKVLLLPARDCLDIQEGLRLGKIDENTHLDLFEKDPLIAHLIDQKCQSWGFKSFKVHNCDINEWFASYSSVIQRCENLGLENKQVKDLYNQCKNLFNYDAIFLDYCCQMSYKTFSAIQNARNAGILSCPVIAFTFSTNLRNNDFYRKDAGVRKGFQYPHNSLINPRLNTSKQAIWSCDKTLSILGLRSKSIKFYMTYNDSRSPMVFFIV